MIAVIFEVELADGRRQQYLDIAASMRPLFDEVDGFISVERFESLTTPGKLLSLSFFRDEDAVKRWRTLSAHRNAQARGRAGVFAGYRLRVAEVLRDYGLHDRDQAPADSKEAHPHGLAGEDRHGSNSSESGNRLRDRNDVKTIR
ncbi:antibiotic biosynthesis monooxygenase [Hoeflea sp. EC-HK425]|uniref:antibiotic biosynthesis monooxygenase family protein n=1 Tax=Hoeflea sp. EC-HK425 TaxID=2038388 RepID=UPI001253024F|nr:antibiotic biosynthesis monooxygenase [Hoeflea sp. EC-HK425]VVT20607.1 Antibiotic biosynthesis monooxygenase (modular protein) [Hoeflea sp. EC-HK425]